MTKAVWYFDFISPFAYLQHEQFGRLPADLEVDCRPVLFAGLLGHWGHKGPAEIPKKRVHIYRYCTWYAARHGILFRLPPAHPFNPLKTLRLALVLDCAPEAIAAIFRAIYAEGADLDDPARWQALTERLGVSDADEKIADPAVKLALRHNTEAAAARGVFGVPTFVVGDELFWGVDSTDMFLDYVSDPVRFAAGEMGRAMTVPVGAERRSP